MSIDDELSVADDATHAGRDDAATRIRRRAVAHVAKPLTPERRAAIAVGARAEQCRRSLFHFLLQAWHVLEPEVPFEVNWHHRLLCDHVQGMLGDWLKHQRNPHHKQRARTANFNFPPGTTKSRVISVMAPAWMWIHRPSWSVICLSANPFVATRDAMFTRDIVTSDWYRHMFGITWGIREDVDAKGNYRNTAGGSRVSLGITSRVVGARADCVAGETMVATEIGDVRIDDLHSMPTPPRVWSVDDVGVVDLREIVASRRIRNREIVEIRTSDDKMIRCTDDHKIHTIEGYERAARIAGRQVSVMRRTDGSLSGSTTSMQSMHDGYVDVRDVRLDVRSSGRRTRQVEASTDDAWPVLFGRVFEEQPTGDRNRLRELWRSFLSWIDQVDSTMLLSSMSCAMGGGATWSENRTRLRVLHGGHDHHAVIAKTILHANVPEPSAFETDARLSKLQLQGASRSTRIVGRIDVGAREGARRSSMHGVSYDEERQRVSGASHRRERREQRSDEHDHALRWLSQSPPQSETPALDSVGVVSVERCDQTIDVYDIQVEGNRNFFAGGILVHNCIMIDDANDMYDVFSEASRREVNGKIDHAIWNRVNDQRSCLRMNMQQRGHVDDASGHLLKKVGTAVAKGGVMHVPVPMEYDPNLKVETPYGYVDPRQTPGQSLHPARFTDEFIASEKQRLGTFGFESQYNQRPAPVEGNLFKRANFRFFKLASSNGAIPMRPMGCRSHEQSPAFVLRDKPMGVAKDAHWTLRLDLDWMCITVDASFGSTSAAASQVGLGVVGGKGALRFVLDDRTAVMDTPTMFDAIDRLIADYPGARRVLVERKANGNAIIQLFQRKYPGFIGLEPEGGKMARANAMSPAYESGNVMLLDGASWLGAHVEELALFDRGPYDDRVDMMSQLMTYAETKLMTLAAWDALSS